MNPKFLPLTASGGLEVQTLVGSHHSILDALLLGPDQNQHAPDSLQGGRHAKLVTGHEKLHRLKDV